MRISISVLLTILLPTGLFSQAQFVGRGDNALGVGAAFARNDQASTIGGGAVCTLGGKFDLGLSYGTLNYFQGMYGSVTTASLSWLFIRRDSASTYASLDLMSVWERKTYRTSPPGTTLDLHTRATALGLSIGLLPGTRMLQSEGFAIQPDLDGVLTFLEDGEKIVTIGFDLSFLIPIGEPRALVPSIGFSRSTTKDGPATSTVALGVQCIFSFTK